MTTKINQVPDKRIETETPTEVHENAEESKHEKLEHVADRAAHKANKTEQQYDQDHKNFSI